MNDTGIGTDLGALGPSPLGLFGFNNPTSQYQVPEYKAIGEGLGFTTTQNVSSYTCRCGFKCPSLLTMHDDSLGSN